MPLGQTLIGLLDSIRVWAESHIEAMIEAQVEYDQRPQEDRTID